MEHTVKAFQDELDTLGACLARMGGMAETQLGAALDAVARHDTTLAQKTIAGDEALDKLDMTIGHHVMRVLALRQPMAVDLRETMAALRVSADLERVGDLAKGIARQVLENNLENNTVPFERAHVEGLVRMGRRALEQVKHALDAYAARHVEKARDVWMSDRELDDMYTAMLHTILKTMAEAPGTVSACTHLLLAARNVERVGDHATNIAETTIFLVTGEQEFSDRPKGGDAYASHG